MMRFISIEARDNIVAVNLPNLLTILRILLIPVFIVIYYMPSVWAYWVTTGIFVFACLTDWLDGYLARKLHQESNFGAFLDPVADKLIVVGALILLVQSYGTALLTIPALIVVSREIVVSALREMMAQYGRSAKVAVVYIGKVKTFLQMTAIAVLLSQPHQMSWHNPIILVGYILLYVAAILTLWSMVIYLHAAWGFLRADYRSA
jgi:CDP-diacylglycerol--glycerol-3-phosphate 3-phosphatidyltransferase